MLRLNSRVTVTARIRFQSAFHLGTGDSGLAASDKGVLRSPDGNPILPGSSLKGVFRSTAERLSYLMGLQACFLEPGNKCASGDEEVARKAREQLKNLPPGPAVDSVLKAHVCDVCRLFGSPLASGKIRFSDSTVDPDAWAGAVEVRDGVALDRDSRTAVDRLKFDYEVVPAGAAFPFRMTIENASSEERALIWVVLMEWARGFKLGGLASRGLGDAQLESVDVREFDLTQPSACKALLLGTEGAAVAEAAMRAEIEALLTARG